MSSSVGHACHVRRSRRVVVHNNVESGGHVRTATCLIASEITIQMFAQLVGDEAGTIALLQGVT